MLAGELSRALLRVHRACDIQTAAIRLELTQHPQLNGVNATLKAMDDLLQPGRSFPLFRRYEVTHERSFYRALDRLLRLRSPQPESQIEELPFEPENPATPLNPAACAEKHEPEPGPLPSHSN